MSAFNKHLADIGHSLARNIVLKSKDDPTPFLSDKDNSVRFKFQSVIKHWELTALNEQKAQSHQDRTKSLKNT